MKITAQLALSQMKVNKKRTIAGIFAIALATSLITTVMCFVTSANKMLTDFLGSDYGEYGGAYSLMLAIPALLLGFLIAAMSITVISNIFSAGFPCGKPRIGKEWGKEQNGTTRNFTV